MFQSIDHLADEMNRLTDVVKSSHNPQLQNEVQNFVAAVSKEADLAFSDVHEILGEIAFLKSSELNEDKVREFQQRLVNTYSKDKFKNVHKICDRLHILAEGYRERIEPFVKTEFPQDNSSQLFWLLHKHEGSFMYTIRNAVDEITNLLDSYKQPSDYDRIRLQAREAQKELQEVLDKVTNSAHRFSGSLHGGTSNLLDTKKRADEVLKNSPLFSLACYLGVTLLLLITLTIVAGNVSPWVFPLIIVATYVGLMLIGAFQLKNDNKLKEENFMKLIDLAARRVLLPFAKLKARPPKQGL